ncbi:arylamine N-acetyltransferase [Achromobacter xylosoxidans]
MHADNFSLARYFDRIGYAGPAHADMATVSELMRRQLYTVPFENLDVQAGLGVSLAPEDIADKILARGRGGYCYEVNGLFCMAMQALGVPYRYVAARPMFYPARRPRTHMALVLRLDGQDWLCDLGFGSYGIRAPMSLAELDTDIRQDMDRFMLSREADGVYVLKAWRDGGWQNQYGFDLSPQEWIDFAPANYLNSNHPDAIFVQKRVVVLHSERGRAILVGNTLKLVDETGTVESELDDGAVAQRCASASAWRRPEAAQSNTPDSTSATTEVAMATRIRSLPATRHS